MSTGTQSGIYAIRCTETGKMYVGSSANIQMRWKQHRAMLREGKHHSAHLQRAWDKYGAGAFVFEVLELVGPEYLIDREQHWIDEARCSDGMNGYNASSVAGLGGAREGTGPKGPRPPRLSLTETIAALREGLSQRPAISLVSTARAALLHLEAARERETELWRLKEVERLYTELQAAWGPLWDAARGRGIEVYQTMGQDDWSWSYEGRAGSAPTPGEALLEALAALRSP